MTEIKIKQINGYHLEALNDVGNIVSIDASPDIGGTEKGMRPMQMLLAALGGCSTIDVLSILKKQQQDVKDIKIVLKGDRDGRKTKANTYKSIHIHFELKGNLDPKKVEKAIELSLDKYCSVAKSLDPSTTIDHSFEVL